LLTVPKHSKNPSSTRGVGRHRTGTIGTNQHPKYFPTSSTTYMLSFLYKRTLTSVCAGRSLFRASPHCLSQGMRNKTICLHLFPRASRKHSVFMSRSRATYPVSSLIQISSRYLERQIGSAELWAGSSTKRPWTHGAVNTLGLKFAK
jgi:hypothetical protein